MRAPRVTRRAACRSTRRSTPAARSSRPSRPTSTRPTSRATTRRGPRRGAKIVILGGGPNRIGQGIEFDYCCVHAALALREDGFETIMVNCNPETVSTDYDTSDKLFFEPLTLEDVLALIQREQPEGVIVQFGGQTPLRLAVPLERAGVPIIGTSPDSIDRAEDRERFEQVLDDARPAAGRRTASRAATRRPSGSPSRSATRCWCARPTCSAAAPWRSCTTATACGRYMRHAVRASPEHPVLIDQFLEDAIEVDVDAVSDGDRRRDRRHHGAHRARRRPLGRQRLLAAAVLDRRRGAGRHPPPDRRAGARARRRRADERAVRGEGPASSTCSR